VTLLTYEAVLARTGDQPASLLDDICEVVAMDAERTLVG
jgi:hypothetical protein